MNNNLFGLVICVGSLLAIVGCGSSAPDLVPVSGIVTLDGKPLIDAVINFQPMASESVNVGFGSNARTDEAGHFELNTIDEKAGALVGKHRVRIFSYSPESPIVKDTDAGPIIEQVPERYNYRSTLTYTVPAEGTDQADFVLTLP